MTRRRRTLGVVVVAIAALVVSAASTAASTKTRTRSIYAVATRAQFVNLADGITRGNLTNPFNADIKALTPKPNGKGPLPGDDSYFTFDLFGSSSLKPKIGTATYSCIYGFHNTGTCEAIYKLAGGTIFASGFVDFAKPTFALGVTGGTGSYLAARGQIGSVPFAKAKKGETKLQLRLAS